MTRRRRWLLLVAGATVLGSGPVYPPVDEIGVTTHRVLAPEHVDGAPDVASIGLFFGPGSPLEERILCYDAGPGDLRRVTYQTAPSAVSPVELAARAFPAIGCAGTPSVDSNPAILYLVGPEAPEQLVP